MHFISTLFIKSSHKSVLYAVNFTLSKKFLVPILLILKEESKLKSFIGEQFISFNVSKSCKGYFD